MSWFLFTVFFYQGMGRLETTKVAYFKTKPSCERAAAVLKEELGDKVFVGCIQDEDAYVLPDKIIR